jgi:DNA polymerase-3 subunit beta
MKFTINREALLIPLQRIVAVIEKRQTMPVLSNVLLVVNDHQFTITGTDLEVQLVSRIALEDSDAGTITVPARKLLEICKLLPKGSEIKFYLHDYKLKVTSGKSRFSLSTISADCYPAFSEAAYEHQFTISAGKLKTMLDKTAFSMANQDVRYYLNGLLLDIADSKIKLVASDGHRLAIYEDFLEHPVDFVASIILPRKAVIELARLLDDDDSEFMIEFSSNAIRASIKDSVFSAKLIDAKYPDFGKVLKQDFLNPISINKQLLKDTITRVATLSNEKYKGVTFDIAPESLRISTHNPEHDEAEDELPIEYIGELLSIAFNAQYLLDAISNLDSGLAVITIASNYSSCLISEQETCEYQFIVMPMRF